MHGGIENYYGTYLNWESKVISDKFIAVYTQEKEVVDAYFRSYGTSGIVDIQELFEQVNLKYPIDTGQIILAGQSMGGYLSIQLNYESISAKGIFLAFPVKPSDFDFAKAQELVKKNTSVVMITGDKNDRQGQKEIAKLMDSANVNNKIFFYPETRHQ